MRASTRSGVSISGRCRWQAIISRSRWSRPTSVTVSPSSLPTASGWRPNRTGRVALRSICDRFQVQRRTRGCPLTAAPRCVGTRMARNCSSSRRTASSCRCRFAFPQDAAEPGRPVALFAAGIGSTAANRHEYAVAPDGQSFVVNSELRGPTAPPISVILNWRPTQSQ